MQTKIIFDLIVPLGQPTFFFTLFPFLSFDKGECVNSLLEYDALESSPPGSTTSSATEYQHRRRKIPAGRCPLDFLTKVALLESMRRWMAFETPTETL